jgi:hypothetical protein
MDEWLELQDVVFEDTIQKLVVDTRDFCCIRTEYEADEKPVDLSVIKKYPDMFYTIEEVKGVLEDLYKRADGDKGDWRMLSFKDSGRFISTSNWNLKYVRI